MTVPYSESAHNPNPQRPTLTAALNYAARGWPVFPCKPGGKAPLTRRGHLDASTDPEQIAAWWTAHPDANIGVPTGERSGLLVLDVDDPAGLDALEAERGELPATRTHSTGSGGMHYLYRYPAGAEIRNSAGKLARGLDVRGEGGYVVVPPSHTTRPYQVLDELPLAEPPAGLMAALRRTQGAASGDTGDRPRTITTATSADLDGGPIPEGARDDTLARIAGRLHDGSRDLDELAGELLEINAARCVPPLPDPQVLKIARSIHRRLPCKGSTRATPEVLALLDGIEARLWRIGWSGTGELTTRDVLVALIVIARRHGTRIPAGVRISVGIRDLALAAGVSRPTVIKATRRLIEAGIVRRDGTGSGTRAGALVLLEANAVGERANLYHSSTGGGSGASGQTLRAPRLRWSAPVFDRVDGEVIRSTIRRLGKGCGAVIDALERYPGGSATVEELAEDLHKSRPRDLRRRVVSRLEEAGVVECSGDTVALVADWLAALNRERESAGEIAAHRRDMARYSRERAAYSNRDRTPAEPVPEPPPAGEVGELERVPDPAPELVAALRSYLDRHPRRRQESPRWLSVALWAEELLPDKPPPAAVEVALVELAPEVAA